MLSSPSNSPFLDKTERIIECSGDNRLQSFNILSLLFIIYESAFDLANLIAPDTVFLLTRSLLTMIVLGKLFIIIVDAISDISLSLRATYSCPFDTIAIPSVSMFLQLAITSRRTLFCSFRYNSSSFSTVGSSFFSSSLIE